MPLDALDQWLQESQLVARGEVVSSQHETPGSHFTQTRYQIRVHEALKGHVASGLLDFTAPGGGFVSSTTDFTLGFGEEVVIFVPEAPRDGDVQYRWDQGHVLSRFVGAGGDWLVAGVETSNSRRALAPSCLTGDLEAEAPVPDAALTAATTSQRSFRRLGELPRHQGCDWLGFLELLRTRSASAQEGARSIRGAAALPPDPQLTQKNWYVHREDMRARFGSPPSPDESSTCPLSPW
jgi:hypothetical protein